MMWPFFFLWPPIFLGRPKTSLESLDRSRLELLIQDDEVKEQMGLPLFAASWTYYPGARDLLRITQPSLWFMFSEQILKSENMSYVHCLEGRRIGVEMRVLDARKVGQDLYALVHAVGRVRLDEEASTEGPLRRTIQSTPLDTLLPDLSFEDTWLRSGRLFAEEERDAVGRRRTYEPWPTIDEYVSSVKASRTSGQFQLPWRLERLRYVDDRERLSYEIAYLLDLDRGMGRQEFIELESEDARLAFAIERLASSSSGR